MRGKNHQQYVLVIFTLCLCFLLPSATIFAALDICEVCANDADCTSGDCWLFKDLVFRCVPLNQGPDYECAVGGGDVVESGCFIATAAYGSIMAPHVKILRNFRDRILLQNSIGKGFVGLYYTYSPPIADFIAKHDSMRAVVRVSLLPVVGVSWVAIKLGIFPTVMLMLLFSIGLVSLLRFRMDKK